MFKEIDNIVENDPTEEGYIKEWQIDYDKERGMYRVSYFENHHYVDDIIFDEVDKNGVN